MQIAQIESALRGLPIPDLRFFPETGSTNEDAARWAKQGAPDMALVIADHQTQGRGRLGRRWITPPGSALAFSLVLQPSHVPVDHLPGITALGALSVRQALAKRYHLQAQIKLPNDVLLYGKKIAGVLAEASWEGDRLETLILGIGINVASRGIWQITELESPLDYPITSLEDCLGQSPDRLECLRAILVELTYWRARLATDEFIHAWEAHLIRPPDQEDSYV